MPVAITHSKVSAAADPSDTSLVGKTDWNDSHVVAGYRHLVSVGFTRDASNVFIPGDVTVEQAPSPGFLAYEYKILFDPSWQVDTNCRFRVFVTDINPALGFFGYAELVAADEVKLTTYLGNWVETYLSANGAIWLDVFRNG